MAVSGTLLTYLSTGNKPDVSDVIDLISYTETPVLSTWMKTPASNKVITWEDYELTDAASDNAKVEGADASTASNIVRSSRTNVTQILEKVIKVSRTQRKIAKYGNVGDELAWQKKAKLQELARDLDKTLLQGTYSAGGSATARTLRGAEAAITSNASDQSSASLTESAFRTSLMKAIWDSGGREGQKTAYCNSFQKNIIDGFTGMSNLRVSIPVSNQSVKLPYNVSAYASSFGMVDIQLTPHATASVVSCIPAGNFSTSVFDAFQAEELGITGDHRSVMIVGEYSLKHRMQSHAGKLYGLSTS